MTSIDTNKNSKKNIHNIITGVFSVLLFIGAAVCAICDMAISHRLSWSLYPISSILFAWLVFIPILKYGSRGILGSLISGSVLIFPFLYVLNELIGASSLFLSISIPTAVIGFLYIWILFFFTKKLKYRKQLMIAWALLLLIPADLLISFVLSRQIAQSFINMWDIMGFAIVVVVSGVFFILDKIQNKTVT